MVDLQAPRSLALKRRVSGTKLELLRVKTTVFLEKLKRKEKEKRMSVKPTDAVSRSLLLNFLHQIRADCLKMAIK